MKAEKLGRDSVFHFSSMAECFKEIGDYENAYFYFKKAKEKDRESKSLSDDIREIAKKINKSCEAEDFLKDFEEAKEDNK